ncbi:fibrillin-1-like [Dendronephthya gigantea]|uniref:fibrillin-1-like n=1 Tax=Dendronephthya gigantea TaxID=151771 RepID=UPI00106DC144|nr:fibrillin-1-like [Dendronephthya gigantea]
MCNNTIGSFKCECNSGYLGDGLSCAEVKSYVGNLSIKNLQYRSIYNNVQSHEYMELRDNFTNAIKELYKNTSYGSFLIDVIIKRIYNGSIRVDYEVIFDSSATNITAQSLNTELESLVNDANGTIGNGFVLQQVNNGRLIVVEDKDECKMEKPCDVNAVCNNTDGSFVCSCNSGYSGSGFTCTDKDECAVKDSCDEYALCNNTVGSFICACKSGFSRDGSNCTDNDECYTDKPCDVNAVCNNTVGSFACVCNSGFSGDGLNCTDMDECIIQDPCDVNAMCNNTVGSFKCECNSGFFGNGFACAVVKTYIGRFSIKSLQYRQIYSNTSSSEYIKLRYNLTNALKELYKKTAYGAYVVDVVINKISNGSVIVDYTVTLNSASNVTAVLLNTELARVINITNGTIGKDLVLGYIQSGRLFVLEDKDECAIDDPCGLNAACNNIDGSFTCVCNPGFSGDGLTCTDIDECTSGPCEKNTTCTNTLGSFNCTCQNTACLPKEDDDDDDLSAGIIALIVVIPIVFVILVIVLVICQQRIEQREMAVINQGDSGVALQRMKRTNDEFENHGYKHDDDMAGIGKV